MMIYRHNAPRPDLTESDSAAADIFEDAAEALNVELGRHVFDTRLDGLSVHQPIKEQ